MFALLDGYQARRVEELREFSAAVAIAHHDPQGIDKAFKPPETEDKPKPVPYWLRGASDE